MWNHHLVLRKEKFSFFLFLIVSCNICLSKRYVCVVRQFSLMARAFSHDEWIGTIPSLDRHTTHQTTTELVSRNCCLSSSS